jgi:DNA-binding response OmpR family regulator
MGLWLSACKNDGVKEPGSAPRLASHHASNRARGPVIVVDSDPAVRRVVRLVLEGAGWRCLTAADAETAFALVAREHPKFVLSEVRLDSGSGADLARRIALYGGWRPRVALMSAYPRPRVGVEDYFVAKPLSFDRLLALLDDVEREPGW